MAARRHAPAVLAFLMAVSSAGLARGHADYERRLLTVRDQQGGPLTLALHFTDGLVGTDPVKLLSTTMVAILLVLAWIFSA